MRKFLDRLAQFFSEEWKQMLVIAIAATLPGCLVYAGYGKNYSHVITDIIFEMGAFFVLAAFLGKWGKILMHMFFTFAVLDFAFSLGCYLANKQHVSIDTFYLIMGTNNEEVSEFFEFYFPLWKILIWAAAILLVCILYLWKRHKLKLPMGVARVLSIVFLVASVLCFPSLKREKCEWFAKVVPIKYVTIARMYEPFGKVAEHRHDLPLTETSLEHPKHIVVIIGESFSKSHSSLYGYKRDTNPELSRLASSGQLLVFSNCEAPAPFTHMAFKTIFSFWNGDENDNWYDHDTFFDVFCQKYATRWISNQQDHGIHENAQVAYANLSDTVWFSCQHKGTGKRYDEVLLPVARSFAENDSTPSITIINLMGQHEAFTRRYPTETWNYFKPSDYTEFKEHQRVDMAQYDNATRYNDHVVASLFDIYKDKEALVFYFPDHGLDLFETDPNYCGHVREPEPRSWEVCCKIPFVIFVTDKYREVHPSQVEKLEQSVQQPFNTGDLIYTLMKITGWSVAGKEPVNRKYLLSE